LHMFSSLAFVSGSLLLSLLIFIYLVSFGYFCYLPLSLKFIKKIFFLNFFLIFQHSVFTYPVFLRHYLLFLLLFPQILYSFLKILKILYFFLEF
jgi:hypothetical protein